MTLVEVISPKRSQAMKVVEPTTMVTKEIVASTTHVEHGQKLVDVSKEFSVDEGTNGSEKEGEKNSEPLADTISGLLGENEQLHYRKRKVMVEDDRDLNGNFKEPPSKKNKSSSLK
jgi:hypothetical protein